MRNKHVEILLVEDNQGDARLVYEILDGCDDINAELTHVDKLKVALERLSESKFDVVFLDLSLPDGKGLEMIASLQDRCPATPIILLTGTDDEAMAVEAVRNGAQDYLVKEQVDANLLVRSMTYAIERQRLLVEMEKTRQLERYLAYHDGLTHLPNRQLFYDRLEQAAVHAKRSSTLVAVMFLDLDNFKRINEANGHSTGDLLLQAVSERLKASLRESDTIARIGGDEFTILLSNISKVEDAVKVAQKLLDEFTKPFVAAEKKFFLTASIGISFYPYDGTDTETLIKMADIAMYRVKGQGKNNYQLFNLSMDAKAFEHIVLENSLRKAIERDELAIYYQPQVSLKSGEITALEALVRWEHPELGLVLPSKFIPIAEESDLIIPLGEKVIWAACRQNKIWQDAGFEPVPIAINLSARQFHEQSLPGMIAEVLEETGLGPEYLTVEITESSTMHDIDYTTSTFDVLKEMGIKIALDDFGTGYSSLAYLKRFPLDMLKIDRTFVKDAPRDREDAAIISAIVALAHSLQHKVIAEGVETQEQLTFLKSLDCDEIQGFFVSRPVPETEVVKFLECRSRGESYLDLQEAEVAEPKELSVTVVDSMVQK
ncbi:EAL domain-containing protein [bacterium]|nr:EAL domain-containing protein [bacterium]